MPAFAATLRLGQAASPGQIELTLALIKPTVCSYQPDVSAVLKTIKKNGFEIVRNQRLFWTPAEAKEFYKEHEGKFFYPRLVSSMTSGPFMALALAGPDAIKRWRELMGPAKVNHTKWLAPEPKGLRVMYGLGDTRNGFHGSDSPESAERELGLIFEGWDTRWWLQRERERSA